MTLPVITVVVPSFNQGRYLDYAFESVFSQNLPLEVFLMDAGSTDNTLDIVHKWAPKLTGWRSHPDKGQAAAINEGIALGCAPYVAWLNSDDWYLLDGLQTLVAALEASPSVPAVYGRSWDFVESTGQRSPVWVEPFSESRLALRCLISQPATLIRRSAWEAVGGVDPNLHMAMDYDLWWRIYKSCGPMQMIDEFVAVNRVHEATKTKTQRRLHYKEAIAVVREHHGSVPWKWWWAQPYAVWWKSLIG